MPPTIPGGKPVTELPGLTPRSSPTVVSPVFVTADPPRTAKLCAVPRRGLARAIAGYAIARINVQMIKPLVITSLVELPSVYKVFPDHVQASVGENVRRYLRRISGSH